MIIEHGKEIDHPQHNTITGNITFDNSKVNFKGKGNILFAEGNVKLASSTISFNGDNAVLYLTGNGIRPHSLVMDLWRETSAYFGAGNLFNGPLNVVLSERKNLIVGANGAFSFGIWLRTADPHLIYSSETHHRLNESKSIVVGDHVWLGQNALILKGCRLGSGSIVAANCVVAGKNVGSNTIYAGNPGKMVRQDIFFTGECVHNYTQAESLSSMKYDGDEYIYNNDGSAVQIWKIDKSLSEAKNAKERLKIIQSELANNSQKNRFYVEPERKKRRFF